MYGFTYKKIWVSPTEYRIYEVFNGRMRWINENQPFFLHLNEISIEENNHNIYDEVAYTPPEPIVEPEPTPEELLLAAKQTKKSEIQLVLSAKTAGCQYVIKATELNELVDSLTTQAEVGAVDPEEEIV